MNFSLRAEIDELIASDHLSRAASCLAQLWREERGPSAAGFVVSRHSQLAPRLNLTASRLFILRSFTVEPIIPLLRAAAFVGGTDLTVQLGDFNGYAPEILDAASRLYRFAPDVVILAVQTCDVAPELWERYTDLSPAEIKATVERVVDSFRTWFRIFRSHNQAHLIVHTLEVPSLPSHGVLDNQLESGQVAVIQQVNQELRRLLGDQSGVYLLDYDLLVARYGRARWRDEHKWVTIRMPIAADKLIYLANEWLRFIHPLIGKSCKVLVSDLDNTLWGGVIAEDGIEGIKLAPEYPGSAYRSLQRAMLDLYRRGIMLAVCSKNNLTDAMEALESHPSMLLRPEHFAALRINWKEKVENLREIAAELNVGTDALAFLDDNPVERARVRAELPEVTVIDLPNDPMDYGQTLRDSQVFERLALSVEDSERGRYYTEQQQRVHLKQSLSSLEDFYHSLQQEVEIAPVTSETVGRVAQLTQKTNQFNLTTRRYTVQQIAEMAANPIWSVYTVRVKDRFGDNGWVGVAITHDIGGVCEIDTFLLSCRVIGRAVETAMLSFLVERARSAGIKQLQGWFLPTKKNEPAKEFYQAHNFQALPEAEQDGGVLWFLDLADSDHTCPDWIRLTISEGVFTQ